MIKSILNFLQNEILGMNWLNRLIKSILQAMGLDTDSRLGGSIHFFIYDVIKIMLLLGFLILIISIFKAISRRREPGKYSADLKVYGQIYWLLFSEQ